MLRLSGYRDHTDAVLVILAACHGDLGELHIGPDPRDRISSDGLRSVAFCRAHRRFSSLREVADALASLASHCWLLHCLALMPGERGGNRDLRRRRKK